MRLRRLEMAVLMITLAFAFFMGGFFTGRSTGSVNVTATAAQQGEQTGIQVSVSRPAETPQNTAEATADSASGTSAQTAPQTQTGGDGSRPAQGTGAVRDSDGKININKATNGELTDLPGIGAVIASRIIDYRTQNGAFAKIEDIQNVSGIGEKRYEAIKDLITVG